MSDELTPAQIVEILRANPEAAIEAVRIAKIAGGRRGRRRDSLNGVSTALTRDEGRGAFGFGPSGSTVRAAKGETRADFDRRVDDLWRKAGWILVGGGSDV